MTVQTIFILILIGFFAGALSGFVGVGGGVIIVPALVFFMGLSQHTAQGTSLFVLSFPVVILAVLNYWKGGHVNWQYGLIIAATFVLGGFLGSKLSLRLSSGMVKLIFGIIMAYISFKLVLSGFNSVRNDA